MPDSELPEKIYKVLTNKKHRAGPLPNESTKKLVLESITKKISRNAPIELLQFWGGCKNPNLPTDVAELCEESTLGHLQTINSEVAILYPPGLKIFITPGDERVQRANYIPRSRTEKYVETLTQMAKNYGDLFSVTPVSIYYKKYSADFSKNLKKAEKNVRKNIHSQPDFDKLVSNARKNIYTQDLNSEKEKLERSKEAAINYVVYRVAEEESQIFRSLKDAIRTYFIRYGHHYQTYIKNVEKTKPPLGHRLVFYTGGKGNVTQPWQAIGKVEEDKVIFLSQERLRLKPKVASV